MSRCRDELSAQPRNTERTHDVLAALAMAAAIVSWYAVILLLGRWQ